MLVETFQLSFPVFKWAYHLDISSFFRVRVSASFSHFCLFFIKLDCARMCINTVIPVAWVCLATLFRVFTNRFSSLLCTFQCGIAHTAFHTDHTHRSPSGHGMSRLCIEGGGNHALLACSHIYSSPYVSVGSTLVSRSISTFYFYASLNFRGFLTF